MGGAEASPPPGPLPPPKGVGGRLAPPPLLNNPSVLLSFTLQGKTDILLHETAVSWLRVRLTESTPTRSWEETRVEYSGRLKRCCDDINAHLEVEGLCRAWPKRIRQLRDLEEGRLRH